jgi:ATP-dependent Lon protease
MTGELSLSGQVLAVGGIREKVLAARRNKVPEVLLPEAKRGDYVELPAYLTEGVTVYVASLFRDVVKRVFPS